MLKASNPQSGGTQEASPDEASPDIEDLLKDDKAAAATVKALDWHSKLWKRHLQRASRPPALFLPRKQLSITRLASLAWCEKEASFNLRVGKPPRSIAMMKGTERHDVLEKELHDVVEVAVETEADRWAIHLVNIVACVKELLRKGKTREIPVLGVLELINSQDRRAASKLRSIPAAEAPAVLAQGQRRKTESDAVVDLISDSSDSDAGQSRNDGVSAASTSSQHAHAASDRAAAAHQPADGSQSAGTAAVLAAGGTTSGKEQPPDRLLLFGIADELLAVRPVGAIAVGTVAACEAGAGGARGPLQGLKSSKSVSHGHLSGESSSAQALPSLASDPIAAAPLKGLSGPALLLALGSSSPLDRGSIPTVECVVRDNKTRARPTLPSDAQKRTSLLQVDSYRVLLQGAREVALIKWGTIRQALSVNPPGISGGKRPRESGGEGYASSGSGRASSGAGGASSSSSMATSAVEVKPLVPTSHRGNSSHAARGDSSPDRSRRRLERTSAPPVESGVAGRSQPTLLSFGVQSRVGGGSRRDASASQSSTVPTLTGESSQSCPTSPRLRIDCSSLSPSYADFDEFVARIGGLLEEQGADLDSPLSEAVDLAAIGSIGSAAEFLQSPNQALGWPPGGGAPVTSGARAGGATGSSAGGEHRVWTLREILRAAVLSYGLLPPMASVCELQYEHQGTAAVLGTHRWRAQPGRVLGMARRCVRLLTGSAPARGPPVSQEWKCRGCAYLHACGSSSPFVQRHGPPPPGYDPLSREMLEGVDLSESKGVGGKGGGGDLSFAGTARDFAGPDHPVSRSDGGGDGQAHGGGGGVGT